MAKARGFILVLLVAAWATLPAFAALCPQQMPPCCRAMQGMCCIRAGASGLDAVCCVRPSSAAVSPDAVVNTTERTWHSVTLAAMVDAPMPESLHTVHARATVAPSPPGLPSHTHSILRI